MRTRQHSAMLRQLTDGLGRWTIGIGILTGVLAWPRAAHAQYDRILGTWPVSVKIDGVNRCHESCTKNGHIYVKIYINGQGGTWRDVDYCQRGVGNCFGACGVIQDDIFVAFNDVWESQDAMLECTLPNQAPITIRIEQWDRDPGDDEHCMTHEFEIDPRNPPPPEELSQCASSGNGGICWTTVLGDVQPLPDSDGDGLYDHWEAVGFDGDCDGDIEWGSDIVLPQLGVNANHKDLLVELDWYTGYAPSADAVQAVRNMFARAPIDAGGIIAPDQEGIRIAFDAGQAVDATGARIGDDLGHYGGGIDLGDPNTAPRSDDEFDILAMNVIDEPQVGLIRTIVFGPEYVVAGGHAMGDFIYLDRTDAVAIAHELGHSLGLGHGGERVHTPEGDWNCKPNHYSIMNYLYGGDGLPYVDPWGTQRVFMDFSPAWIDDPNIVARNTRMTLLPDLLERNTDETEWRLETTPNHLPRQEIMFTSKCLHPTTTPVGGDLLDNVGYIDWNCSTRPDEDGVQGVNVNTGADDDVNLDLFPEVKLLNWDGIPACYNSPQNQALSPDPLRHIDEWSIILMKPIQNPGEPVLVGTLVSDPMPTPEEQEAFREVTSLADLSIIGEVVTEPIQVDVPFLVSILANNGGPSIAHEATLRLTVPEGVSLVNASHECAEWAPGMLDCDLVVLLAGQEQEVSLEFVAEPNATLGSRELGVQILHAGGDIDTSNNTISIPIRIIPTFASFEDPTAPWVQSWVSPPAEAPLSDNASDGSHSMSLSCGNSSFDSPAFDTVQWEVLGSELWVDVFIPAAQSNPYWVGDLMMHVDLPAAGLNNVFLGQTGLTDLPRGTWSTVSFPVAQNVQDALLGDYPDARLRLSVNVASCIEPVLVDHIRFGGELLPRTQYHGTTPIDVDVVGPLSFDNVAEWSSEQVALWSDSDLLTEGAASLSFAPLSWTELTSRPLTAQEGARATSVLHLDVHVPDLPPDPYWVGDVQLYADCPSLELYNQYVGQDSLYPSFDDEFNSLLFALPDGIVNALHGGAEDCTIKFAVSMNPAWGILHFDRGGFVE